MLEIFGSQQNINKYKTVKILRYFFSRLEVLQKRSEDFDNEGEVNISKRYNHVYRFWDSSFNVNQSVNKLIVNKTLSYLE